MSRPFYFTARIFLLGIFFTVGCGSSPPQDSLKAIFLSANAGNYTEATAGLSDQIRQTLDQAGMMRLVWDGITKKGTIKTIEIKKSEVRGEGATIYYKIIYKDGSKVESDETMTKENGAWKIGSVKFLGIFGPGRTLEKAQKLDDENVPDSR